MESRNSGGSSRRDLDEIKDEFQSAADETAKLAAEEYQVIKAHAKQVFDTAMDSAMSYAKKKPLEGLGMVFMSGVFVGLLLSRGKTFGL